MLDTQFPRLKGDIGNPASFQHPVNFQTVSDAVVDRVVVNRALESTLIEHMQQCARQLEVSGAEVIGTSCGFLIQSQNEIQSAISVPFLSSSLLWLPELVSRFGSTAAIGVLTFSAVALDRRHFRELIPDDQPLPAMIGLNTQSELYRVISEDRTTINKETVAKEIGEWADQIRYQFPQLEVLVLECTNLSPWREVIEQRSGLKTFDLIDLIHRHESDSN